LRSRSTDERLNSIAILNIESDITKGLDYDDIINEFSFFKARKKNVNFKYLMFCIIVDDN